MIAAVEAATQPPRVEPLWAPDPPISGSLVRGGALPPDLRARYGSALEIPLRTDRPTLVVNFVSTLDGAVALDRRGATGGREISGGFEPDRFVMGLLRATADAVLVGAGTVRASRTRGWTPDRAHPASAAAFADWRTQLGMATRTPVTVIVSATGALESQHIPTDPDAPVLIATTTAGARRLAGGLPPLDHVEVVPIATGDRVPATALVDVLGERGFGLVLSEGGPTLFGELLAAGLVDELFLTLAPRLAGRRPEMDRLALVEGLGFAQPDIPRARLSSVMHADDYLFLRYALAAPEEGDPA